MGVITDERDEVIRALTRHCGDGRLTLDELEDRIAEAYAATTDEELRHALRELPVERPEPAPVLETERPPVSLPPLPPLPPVHRPAEANVDVNQPPEWEKAIGALFVIGGFVLLFNGMFWLALFCWFVLPGLALKHRSR